MTGYRGTPLPKKLGNKEDMRVGIFDAPDGFRTTLGPLPEGTRLHDRQEPSDIFVVFARWTVDMRSGFESAMANIGPSAVIWVAWPKRTSGVETDLTEDTMRTSFFRPGWWTTRSAPSTRPEAGCVSWSDERTGPIGRAEQMSDSFFIVTGAPGTGKTAILAALTADLRSVAEPARAVLAEERAAGGDGTPEQNAARFTELLLQRSIDNYRTLDNPEEVLFFLTGASPTALPLRNCSTLIRTQASGPLPDIGTTLRS